MESKANYALVGVFVLVAVLASVWFIFFISGRQFDENYSEYIVVFDTPPRGISVGSEVRFNGLNMGEVIKTTLDPGNINNVFVYIRVDDTTPVFADTTAKLEPLGLTGLSYIQLFGGQSKTPLKPPNDGQYPRIKGKGSQIDILLEGSDSVIDNINLVLARTVKVLSPEATEDLHGIFDNINQITTSVNNAGLSSEQIAETLAAIEQAALDVSIASLSVDTTAKDVSAFLVSRPDLKNVLVQGEKTLKTAETTLDAYTTLAQSGTDLSDEALRTIEQFASTGLQDLSIAMAEFKALVESLNRVSENLERNPVGFIVGQEKEITELPQ